VHAGLGANSQHGITIASLAAANDGVLQFTQPNAATWSGQILYSHYDGSMQLWSSASQSTSSLLCGLFRNGGLVVGPPLNTTPAQSCLTAAGTSSNVGVSTTGVHMGICAGYGPTVRLVNDTATNVCSIDFNVVGLSPLAHGAIQYYYAVDMLLFICNGSAAANLSPSGLLISPQAGFYVSESALCVTGDRVATTPVQYGIHAGMITQNAASISLVASAQTYVSYLQFCYAGQTTNAYGQIVYSNSQNRFQFFVAGTEYMRLTTTGLGLNVLAPLAPLHVYGLYGSSVGTGVLAGVDNTITTTAKLCICAGSATGLANLDFSYTGQASTGNPGSATTAACKARISCNMSSGLLLFYTQQGGTAAMAIDGSTANQTVLIGTTTTSASYKLVVVGNSYFAGTTTATGTKTFDIPHPTKANHRLRHRCVESPKARLLYEFQVDCQPGTTSVELADWLVALNTNFRAYCSPFRHFGAAWAEVVGSELQVTSNCAGAFNVLLLGTRSDQAARDEFAEFGVEYETPL